MTDEDPYTLPAIDESKWFSGGHLGQQNQMINWQVVNCTTPANYFHVLRRQVSWRVSQCSGTALTACRRQWMRSMRAGHTAVNPCDCRQSQL